MSPGSENREIRRAPALAALCRQAISTYSPGATESPVATPKFERLLVGMVGFGADFLDGVHAVRIYSAGMRSVVVQISSADAALVIKHFRRRDSATNSGGFGYLREKHGLPLLNSLVPGSYSRLLAFNDADHFLALEKVPGSPLFTPLLSNSPDGAAAQALTAYVDFWSELLTATGQKSAQENFVRGLASADPQASNPGALPSPQLAFKGLEKLCLDTGLSLDSADFTRQRAQVENIIYPAPDQRVFSSGDFSPANLLARQLPGQARAIDAEGSCLHHWALAVAEFQLGFPSYPGMPLPRQLVKSQLWLSELDRLYRSICPSSPAASPYQDERVSAAVLTIRAILREQTG